jgi:dihydrofolate reductase
MGRRTYEAANKRLGESTFSGTTAIVLAECPQDHPEVTVVSELNPDWVRTLQPRSGKDICLFGGSEPFRSFLDSGHVDTVGVNVIPGLLGGGVPRLPPPYNPAKLCLLSHRIYRSGRVSLAYQVQH